MFVCIWKGKPQDEQTKNWSEKNGENRKEKVIRKHMLHSSSVFYLCLENDERERANIHAFFLWTSIKKGRRTKKSEKVMSERGRKGEWENETFCLFLLLSLFAARVWEKGRNATGSADHLLLLLFRGSFAIRRLLHKEVERWAKSDFLFWRMGGGIKSTTQTDGR